MLTTGQKQSVRKLRAQGLTYSEIQQNLNIRIAKSSLSYICRDVKMGAAYDRRLKAINRQHLRQASKLAVEQNRKLHHDKLNQIEMTSRLVVSKLSNDESLKVALAMLYLGEGSKWVSYRGLRLGNSSPEVVCLYIALLEKCYGITRQKLRVRVQCRADQDVTELEQYWSKVTAIPLEQFHKAGVDLRTIGKPTKKRDYKGVCVIICNGTQIQLELAFIAKSLLHNVGL